jgi:DnaK suppressor protein
MAVNKDPSESPSAPKKARAPSATAAKTAAPEKPKSAAKKAPTVSKAKPPGAAKPAAGKTNPAPGFARAAPPAGAGAPPESAVAPAETASPEVPLASGYEPSPDEEYMNPRQLAYFRRKLADWRDALLRESQQTIDHLRSDGASRYVGDEADRARDESEVALELRTRDRYRKLLPKIEAALRRIEDGSYGYCEETGEPIGLKRLEARPIATLSVEAQELREKSQRGYRDDG